MNREQQFADSTLKSMGKVKLIEIIRCLEKNNVGLQQTIHNQANNLDQYAREFAIEQLEKLKDSVEPIYEESLNGHGNDYGNPNVENLNEVGRIIDQAITALKEQKGRNEARPTCPRTGN